MSIAPQKMKGAYCAAKSAMNAAHDSFWFDEQGSKSLESVSLVLPGPVATRFREHALAALQPLIGWASAVHREKYKAMEAALAPGARIKPFTASALDVAEKIYRAAGATDRLELDLFPGPHAWGANKSAAFFAECLGLN